MTNTVDQTLQDFAIEVRSKNAGPFWMTMEAFMIDEIGYTIAANEGFLNEGVIARLYDVDANDVQMFRIPELNVVKISFPRRVAAGGLRDRDMHCGQQHVPLATLPIPPELIGAGPAA